jgi:hypothetical protein
MLAMPAKRRPTGKPQRKPSSMNGFYLTRAESQAILSIIERNTERISRLEDVFALHEQKRIEVEAALKIVKARLKRNR